MRPPALNHAAGLVLALPLLLGGCKSCGGGDAAPDAAVTVEPAVAPPEGLLAEGTLVDPGAVWQRLQRNVGGVFAFFPPSLGGVVAAVARLDPALSAELGPTEPAYFALGTDTARGVVGVFAFHLSDARHARSLLLPADAGPPREVAGFAMLTAQSGGMVAAISKGGYLLVAPDEPALARLGPYAARTLPTRPVPHDSAEVVVPKETLEGAVRARVKETWTGLRAALASPDPPFADAGLAADPNAILQLGDAWVQSVDALLGDLREVRVTLDVDDGGFGIRAVFPALTDAGAARQMAREMTVGDLRPLLATPASADVALLVRSNAAERAASEGQAVSAILGMVGGKADKAAIEKAVREWTKGRGDWLSGAAKLGLAGDEAREIVVETPAADEASAEAAVKDAVELASRPPFLPVFASALQIDKLESPPTDVAGVARGHLVTMKRASASGGATSGGAKGKDGGAGGGEKIGLAWGIRDGLLEIAVAPDAAGVLGRSAGALLGEDLRLAARLDKFGPNAAFAVAGRVPDPRGAAQAPASARRVVLVTGRSTEGDLALDLEGSYSILSALVGFLQVR